MKLPKIIGCSELKFSNLLMCASLYNIRAEGEMLLHVYAPVCREYTTPKPHNIPKEIGSTILIRGVNPQ